MQEQILKADMLLHDASYNQTLIEHDEDRLLPQELSTNTRRIKILPATEGEESKEINTQKLNR